MRGSVAALRQLPAPFPDGFAQGTDDLQRKPGPDRLPGPRRTGSNPRSRTRRSAAAKSGRRWSRAAEAGGRLRVEDPYHLTGTAGPPTQEDQAEGRVVRGTACDGLLAQEHGAPVGALTSRRHGSRPASRRRGS